MFSRNVSYKLKAKSAAEFTRIVEGEVIPLLRRQKGLTMQSVSSRRSAMKRSRSVCGTKKKTRRPIS